MFELFILIIGSFFFLLVWAIPFLPFFPREISKPNIYNSLMLFLSGGAGWSFILVILKDYMNQGWPDLVTKYNGVLILAAVSPIYTYIKHKR